MSRLNEGRLNGLNSPPVLESGATSPLSKSKWEAIGIPPPPAYSPIQLQLGASAPPTPPPRLRKETASSSITCPISDLSSSISIDAVFDPKDPVSPFLSALELEQKETFYVCVANCNAESVPDTYGTLPPRTELPDAAGEAFNATRESSFLMSEDDEDEGDVSDPYFMPDARTQYVQFNAVSVRNSDSPGPVWNEKPERDSVLSVTEEGYAHWFRNSEAVYVTQLDQVIKMVEILSSGLKEADDVQPADSDLLVALSSKLHLLKAAVVGMQALARDLHRHLDAQINSWKLIEGPPRFMHIYSTRGQYLRMYPSDWFAVIDSVLYELNLLKQSADPLALRLLDSIQEQTGESYSELLQYPLTHLSNFRSKLEKYVDYLEEPEQQKMNGANEECINAGRAFDMLKDIMESEDQQGSTEALMKLADLFSKSAMRIIALDPRRKLQKYGEFTASGKKYLAYLFNDILLLLLLANEKKGEKIDFFDEVTDWAITNSHGPTFEFIAWPNRKKYIFTARSVSECREWLATLADVKDKQTSGKRNKVAFQKAGQERWVPDEQRTQCTICGCKFTPTCRRHHCRHCGEIFCSKCTPSSAWVKYESQKQRSRTCTQCFKEYCSILKEDRSLSSSFKDLSVSVRRVPSRSKSMKCNTDRVSSADDATVVVEYHIPASDASADTSRLPKKWIKGQLFLVDDVLGIAKDNKLAFSVSLCQVCPLFDHFCVSEDSLVVQLWQSKGDKAGRAANKTSYTRIVKLLIEIRWCDEQLRKSWAHKIERQRQAFSSIAR